MSYSPMYLTKNIVETATDADLAAWKSEWEGNLKSGKRMKMQSAIRRAEHALELLDTEMVARHTSPSALVLWLRNHKWE